MKSHGLHTYVLNNNLKSLALLAGFLAVIQLMAASIWAASALLFFKLPTKQAFITHVITMTAQHSVSVLVGSLVWAFLAFVYYTSILRNMTGLHPASRLAETRLYNIVENLSIATGLATPAIEISESPKLNAFAMGLTPASSTIGVTRGLLHALNDRELEAVIAHELTHIRTLDVRLMTLATIFCGIIFSLGWFLTYRMRELFRQFETKPIVILPIMIWIAAMSMALPDGLPWLVPLTVGSLIMSALLIALGLRFAISRTREYVADLGACELTKNPEALISALAKIHGRNLIPQCDPTVQAMMIAAPSEGFFASHPSLEERIDAIVAYAATHLNGLRLASASARILPQVETAEAQSSFSITKMKYPAWVSKPLIVVPALLCGVLTFAISKYGLVEVFNQFLHPQNFLKEVLHPNQRFNEQVFSSVSDSLHGTINSSNKSPSERQDAYDSLVMHEQIVITMIFAGICLSLSFTAKTLRSYGWDSKLLRDLSGAPSKLMQSDWEELTGPENTHINAAIAQRPTQRPVFGKAPPR
jgi:heat shock protein HtpX